jgi:hypothetical protein
MFFSAFLTSSATFFASPVAFFICHSSGRIVFDFIGYRFDRLI